MCAKYAIYLNVCVFAATICLCVKIAPARFATVSMLFYVGLFPRCNSIRLLECGIPYHGNDAYISCCGLLYLVHRASTAPATHSISCPW